MPSIARAQAAGAQKEARQKKLLLVLAPILVILLAWQGPGIIGGLKGTDPAGTAEEQASPPASATAPATTTTGPPPGAGGSSAALPETYTEPRPDPNNLVSLEHFQVKDPFRQQIAAAPPADATSSTDGSASTPTPSDGAATTGTVVPPPSGSLSGGGPSIATDDSTGGQDGEATPGAGTAPEANGAQGGSREGEEQPTATVSVNGSRERVRLREPFPESDPTFRLVSIGRTSAKLALVTGTFTSGARTITLRLGKPMTLVSQPDGRRYRFELLSVSPASEPELAG